MKFNVGDIVRAPAEINEYHYRITGRRLTPPDAHHSEPNEYFIERHSTGVQSAYPVGHKFGWFRENTFVLVKSAQIESAADMDALYG